MAAGSSSSFSSASSARNSCSRSSISCWLIQQTCSIFVKKKINNIDKKNYYFDFDDVMFLAAWSVCWMLLNWKMAPRAQPVASAKRPPSLLSFSLAFFGIRPSFGRRLFLLVLIYSPPSVPLFDWKETNSKNRKKKCWRMKHSQGRIVRSESGHFGFDGA